MHAGREKSVSASRFIAGVAGLPAPGGRRSLVERKRAGIAIFGLPIIRRRCVAIVAAVLTA
jgi:hypothetical protein